MKNLVWLASYPKSGNTWLRFFFANFLVDKGQPVPINHLERYSTGDSVARNYRAVCKSRSFDPLDDRAALQLRDSVFRAFSENGASINLVKTHCKNKRVESVRLIPAHLTRAAIYVVRNPLDMLLSYADHYRLEPVQAASDLANPQSTILPSSEVVRQFTGNWSDHVRSWTKNPKFPVTVLRYEDMLSDPQAAFEQVIAAVGVPADPDRVARAIAASSFAEAQRQEDSSGFIEKAPHSKKFFRSGKSGEGERLLADDVIASIRSEHRDIMTEFGYLE